MPISAKVYCIYRIILRDNSEYSRLKTVDLCRFSEPVLQSLRANSHFIFPQYSSRKDTSPWQHTTSGAKAFHWIRHQCPMQLTNQQINWQAPNHIIGSGTTVPFRSRDNALAHAAQLYSSYLSSLYKNHFYIVYPM